MLSRARGAATAHRVLWLSLSSTVAACTALPAVDSDLAAAGSKGGIASISDVVAQRTSAVVYELDVAPPAVIRITERFEEIPDLSSFLPVGRELILDVEPPSDPDAPLSFARLTYRNYADPLSERTYEAAGGDIAGFEGSNAEAFLAEAAEVLGPSATELADALPVILLGTDLTLAQAPSTTMTDVADRPDDPTAWVDCVAGAAIGTLAVASFRSDAGEHAASRHEANMDALSREIERLRERNLARPSGPSPVAPSGGTVVSAIPIADPFGVQAYEIQVGQAQLIEAQLRGDLDGARHQLVLTQQRLNAIEQELRDAQSGPLSSQVAELRRNRDRLSAMYGEAQEKLQQTEASLANVRARLSELRPHVDGTSPGYLRKNLQDRLEELENIRNERKALFDQREAYLGEANGRLNDSKAELSNQVEALEAERNAIKKELSTHHKALAELEERAKHAREEARRLLTQNLSHLQRPASGVHVSTSGHETRPGSSPTRLEEQINAKRDRLTLMQARKPRIRFPDRVAGAFNGLCRGYAHGFRGAALIALLPRIACGFLSVSELGLCYYGHSG